MKKLINTAAWLCAFMLVSNATLGQEAPVEETQTLFGGANALNAEKIGYFIAPGFAYTEMDGASVGLFQARAGVSYDGALSIGGFYEVSMNEIYPKSETLTNVYMDYWATGGFIEYTLLSDKLVHISFPVSAGFGEVQMDNEAGEAGLGESNFFVLEPAALLEVNLAKYVKLNAGAGYRVVGQMNYRNFNQNDLSGFNGRIGLKIGLFK
jgi:hypothetical protein